MNRLTRTYTFRPCSKDPLERRMPSALPLVDLVLPGCPRPAGLSAGRVSAFGALESIRSLTGLETVGRLESFPELSGLAAAPSSAPV